MQNQNDTRKTASGLSAVPVEEFLRPYLYTTKQPATVGELRNWLKKYATGDEIEGALGLLAHKGEAGQTGNKWALTSTGRKVVDKQFGAGLDRKRLQNVAWPALALGLPPSDLAVRRRIGRPALLAAATMAVVYELPLEPTKASLNDVACSLVLRGLAGQSTASAHEAQLKELVLGLPPLKEAGDLRAVLITAALELARKGGDPTSPTAPPDKPGLAAFAERVNHLLQDLSTPPLSRDVAIGQVYDAYGRQHADAGSLQSFKERLFEAHKAELLDLKTLDRPETIDRDLRERSELQGKQRRFHLITRRGDS